MPASTKTVTIVVKHPGKKAEAMMLETNQDLMQEAKRILKSAEGRPTDRPLSRGDKPYPEPFKRPGLWIIFDDEFGYFSMEPNSWGIKGPIVIARATEHTYGSLNPDEVQGVIEELDMELPKDPDDWEQTFKNLGKYF